MRAFAYDEFGKPGSVRDVEVPVPEGDQVLVRVRAASVNPWDVVVVNGHAADMMPHSFPLVPGTDLAGVVVEAPPGSGFAPGDEVYGAVSGKGMGRGSWAELVTTPAKELARTPDGVSDANAAAFPVAGLTALEAVEAAGLREGDVLLVVGATGGVGGYSVRFAVHAGARVVAVARREKADYARELGAAETIDYTAGDVVEQVRAAHPDGVAAVIDTYGQGQDFTRLAAVVRDGGAVISTRGSAGEDPQAERGVRLANANRAPLSRLVQMDNLFEQGVFSPVSVTTYRLADANDAVAELAGGHAKGKHVLVID